MTKLEIKSVPAMANLKLAFSKVRTPNVCVVSVGIDEMVKMIHVSIGIKLDHVASGVARRTREDVVGGKSAHRWTTVAMIATRIHAEDGGGVELEETRDDRAVLS